MWHKHYYLHEPDRFPEWPTLAASTKKSALLGTTIWFNSFTNVPFHQLRRSGFGVPGSRFEVPQTRNFFEAEHRLKCQIRSDITDFWFRGALRRWLMFLTRSDANCKTRLWNQRKFLVHHESSSSSGEIFLRKWATHLVKSPREFMVAGRSFHFPVIKSDNAHHPHSTSDSITCYTRICPWWTFFC